MFGFTLVFDFPVHRKGACAPFVAVTVIARIPQQPLHHFLEVVRAVD